MMPLSNAMKIESHACTHAPFSGRSSYIFHWSLVFVEYVIWHLSRRDVAREATKGFFYVNKKVNLKKGLIVASKKVLKQKPENKLKTILFFLCVALKSHGKYMTRPI